MKRRFFLVSVILFFFLMLGFPKPVFDGASQGLLLWFNIVLPTLLPFIILSNLLLQTHAINSIARITKPVFSPLFHVSDYGSFAVLAGFLCGYPMGSKVTADLMRNGHISATEGQYLLSFCNNTSPMFIISFILMQNLKNESYTIPALGILFSSPVICSFIFRRKYFSNNTSINYKSSIIQASHSKDHTRQTSGNSILDTCIMNGFETITKVGGYIMLFSILNKLFLMILGENLLSPSLEITNGIVSICQSNYSDSAKFLLCMVLTSFGGWCSVAQTQCMIQGTPLRIFSYTKEKLVTALVTSLLALLYLFIFKS